MPKDKLELRWKGNIKQYQKHTTSLEIPFMDTYLGMELQRLESLPNTDGDAPEDLLKAQENGQNRK